MIISFSRRIAMLFYFILTISLCSSFAIHNQPLQHTSQRRRIVLQNNNDNININQSVPSVLFSSSDDNNDSSDNGDNIVDAINHDKDITIKNTSAKSSSISSSVATVEDEKLSIWPQNDELDKRMMKIALPCIANFAINPLIGAVDLFWVNRSKCLKMCI